MKKHIILSTLLVTAGIAFVAGAARDVPLTGGTVLDPFRIAVVSATRITGVTRIDRVRPVMPVDPGDGDVRPGPFTPPPRSPFAPPPR